MEMFSHGEVTIFETNSVPKNAKKLLIKNKEFKVADSETTGNHHMVEVKEGMDIYEKDGVFYLRNEVPVNVFCKVMERHDTITLKPSIWEIDKAKEFDYLTMEKRNVAD